VITKFECGIEFWGSWKLVQSCDCGASRADEFQGGTNAGGVTGDVTGLELAKVCQQSHMSVMGCNMLVVAIDSEVLFQSLISLFSLSITFGMISGSEV